LCRGSFVDELCKKNGGKYCKKAFQDPWFRRRNVLALNEVFGTRNCYSGYEGLVDSDDMFRSCHLTIYEPSFFIRHTTFLITMVISSCLALCVLFGYVWSLRAWNYWCKEETVKYLFFDFVDITSYFPFRLLRPSSLPPKGDECRISLRR